MVWRRRLHAPVEQVWSLVSTLEGLQKWWRLGTKEFDLRPGGAFRHHWDNVILDFNENHFINFDGMRWELRAKDGGTNFAFIDTWGGEAVPPKPGLGSEQPGGPGTPWAGVAAGWHGIVDALEEALTGKPHEDLFETRCRYYAEYLSDYYRWMKVLQSRPPVGGQALERPPL
jgi:uncharacterized protein YndB with AHSA1/START domain